MEELLNEIITEEDLKKYEKIYYTELSETNVSYKAQFDYAWCLVRSQLSPDIKKGILLLEDLASMHSEGKRDYVYYLAIANTRLKEYNVALKYCKAILQIEPYNQQAMALEQHIQKKIDRENLTGVAVAGGAALIVGGLIGLGFALVKNSSNQQKSSRK